MNRTQALCGQRGEDGLNEGDHALAEIMESEQCRKRAIRIAHRRFWQAARLTWRDCLMAAAFEIFEEG